MSDKGAKSYGLQYQEWEREALARIALTTNRTIAYRPKPSRSDPQKPISGLDFAGEPLRLKDALMDAWAVVTHHSNVGIDGMLIGVEVKHLKAMFPSIYAEICSRILDALTDQVVKSKDGNAFQNPFVGVMNRQALLMLKAGSEMGFSPSARASLGSRSDG